MFAQHSQAHIENGSLFIHNAACVLRMDAGLTKIKPFPYPFWFLFWSLLECSLY